MGLFGPESDNANVTGSVEHVGIAERNITTRSRITSWTLPVVRLAVKFHLEEE